MNANVRESESKSNDNSCWSRVVISPDFSVVFNHTNEGYARSHQPDATSTEVEGVRTWIMTAEHLVAIALQTGREKDNARILQFLERNVVDLQKLQSILSRHRLKSKWSNFRTRYLD